MVGDVPPVFTYDRDPKDEKYVNLAIAGNASFIVSRDKDLLDLDRTIGTPSIGSTIAPLRIVDPITMLQILRESTPGSN